MLNDEKRGWTPFQCGWTEILGVYALESTLHSQLLKVVMGSGPPGDDDLASPFAGKGSEVPCGKPV